MIEWSIELYGDCYVFDEFVVNFDFLFCIILFDEG